MAVEHTVYYIFPNSTNDRVWVVADDGAWTLPSLTFAVPDGESELLNTGHFNKAFFDQFNIDVTTLYAFHWRDPDIQGVIKIFNLENHSSEICPPIEGCWAGCEDLKSLNFGTARVQSVMDAWFKQADASVSKVEPCFYSGWISEVNAWVSNWFEPAFPPEQVRFWQRSAVLRMQTQEGNVYFKACPRELKNEVIITDFLAQKIPNRIQSVIATDQSRNWMLTQEIDGVKLETISEIEPWVRALQAYVQLQRDSLAFIDDLVMCPDWRPRSMVSAFENMIDELQVLLDEYPEPLNEDELDNLRAMVPRFQNLCDEIEGYDVPCTLEHCDANGDNFWMGSNGLVVSDWAEACVTHPFIGLVNFLSIDEEFPKISDVKIRFQNAYLEAWSDVAPLTELEKLLQLIPPLKRLQDALHYTKQFEMVVEKLDDGIVLPHSYAKWTLNQVHSWVPHYWRILLEEGFAGLSKDN